MHMHIHMLGGEKLKLLYFKRNVRQNCTEENQHGIKKEKIY